MKIDNNRLITPYERMDGLFTNYTKIKEVEELPNPSYKATIYMNNEVGKEFQYLFASMGVQIDYTKPIDFVEFVKSYFTGAGVSGTINIGVYKTLKEGESKFIPKDETYYFDLICDINKLYGNIIHEDKYEDMTETVCSEFNIVYIGNDINEIGKHDQTFQSLVDVSETLTGGLYVVWEEGEEISTDTIYKKEILEEGTPINTNYIFGENLGTFDGTEEYGAKVQTLFDQHKGDNPKWSEEDTLLVYAYEPLFGNTNIEKDDKTLKLLYDSSLGKYTFTTKFNDDSEVTTKIFDTIKEVSNFIINDESFTKILGSVRLKGNRDGWKEYDLTPIYTDKLDESLDLTKIPYYVVMGPSEGKVHTGTYKYYIFNGSEYIEIGGNNSSEDASNYIIKEVEGTSDEELAKVTFTKEELEEFKKGKDLLLVSTADEIPMIVFARNNSYVLLDKDNNIGVITFAVNVNILLGYSKGSLLLTFNEDKAALGTLIEEKMVNFYVGADIMISDWTENTSYINYSNLGYKYSTTKAVKGLAIDTSSLVNVTFSIEDSLSGNFAPCCESVDSGVIIFAKEKPTKTTTISVEVIY